MSWAKLDDRANEHEKQIAAGPKACWLWACGLMYCNRQAKKIGRIPKAVVDSGMLFPGLGKSEAKRLIAVGLWHDSEDAYEVHEFHGWNPELREKRAEAGRTGGKRSGEARREANSKQLASSDEANNEATQEPNDEATDEARAQARVRTRTDARGIHPTPPHPDGENPPNPPRRIGHLPTAESIFSQPTWLRPDVVRLHERWKLLFGLVNHKLRAHSPDADYLADALDSQGEETCNRVLDWAPKDGMVSGRDDEKRAKHESIAYIFGNEQAFARMERDSREAKKGAEVSGVSVVERLRAREAQ